MSVEKAFLIVGHRPLWELQAMRRALSIHQFLNTPEENLRLQAVKVLLKGLRK